MPLVTAIVLLPLLGALSMLFLHEGNRVQARIHALVASLATLGLTVGLVAVFDEDVAELQRADVGGWASEAGLTWRVGVDGISLWLLVLTAVVFALAIIAACWRLPDRGPAFLGLLLAAETGLLGLFSSGDLVLFYVFWEAMLIPFYFLIGMWGNRDRGPAVLKFVIYTMVGSLLMLVAIVATAFIAQDITGTLTFDIEALRGVAFSETQSTLLFAGFALAFLIKLPMWPFHAWLPDAYRAAPIIVTALLAAVMSKAGVYGLLRIGLPVFPEGADNFAIPIGVLSVIGIVYGSLYAWRAPTMRLLVGYSSLAHLGFILLGVVAFDLQASQGAVLQMVNHGIVVAAAFGIVGIITAASGPAEDDREIDGVRGLAAGAPRLAGIFLIVAMASLAIPGSNTFVGEFFILTGVFRHHPALAIAACLGIVYASVYMLRLYQTSMNDEPRGADPREARLRARHYAYLLPLVAAMLAIALWPKGIVDQTGASLERAIAPAQVAAGRPADQIRGEVTANPPASALPLPGDPPAADPAAATGAAP